MEADEVSAVLLCGWIRPDAYSPLGLSQWRIQLRACTDVCPSCFGDVLYRCFGFSFLRLQSPGEVLPRSVELRGLQSPALAPPPGSDVLLVAPVVKVYHGVQTQPALSRHHHTDLVYKKLQDRQDSLTDSRWVRSGLTQEPAADGKTWLFQDLKIDHDLNPNTAHFT